MSEQEKKKKLNTLPWQALFDLAISKEINEDQIKGKDKAELISKLLSEALLLDSEIDDLVNNYIYGDRVTFTLWSFERQLTKKDHTSIYQLEGYVEPFLRASNFRGLKILSVRDCHDRIEILYVYSKEYAYIDEDGKNATVWEQHRGCLWIGISSTYLACISKHDKMTSCITAFITEKTGIPLSQVNPPKKAVDIEKQKPLPIFLILNMHLNMQKKKEYKLYL